MRLLCTVFIVSLGLWGCGSSEESPWGGWWGGKAEDLGETNPLLKANQLPRFTCKYGHLTEGNESDPNESLSFHAKSTPTAVTIVSALVENNLLGQGHNFASCEGIEGVWQAKELPEYRCEFGHRNAEGVVNPKEPVVFHAFDAATATGVMSGLIQTGLLGDSLNYVSCGHEMKASAQTAREPALVDKKQADIPSHVSDTDMPSFLCMYGYANASRPLALKPPVDLRAPNIGTAASVISGIVGSSKLGAPLNFVECSIRDTVPASLSVTIDKTDTTAVPGEILFKGRVCNRGSTKSKATALNLVYTGAHGTSNDGVEIDNVEPGCTDWTKSHVFSLGRYTIQATIRGETQSAIATFVVDPSGSPPPSKADLVLELDAANVTTDGNTKQVVIAGKVCNHGSVASEEPTTIRLINLADSSVDLTAAIPILLPTICHDWDLTLVGVEPGQHSVTLTVDPDDLVDEVDEDANEQVLSLEMPGPTLPASVKADLNIKTVVQQPTATNVTLQIEVCNNGSQPAPAFQVGIFLGRKEMPTCFDTPSQLVQLSELAPGQCASGTSEAISRQTAGVVGIMLVADPTCVVAEDSDDNNHKAVILQAHQQQQSSPATQTQTQTQTQPQGAQPGFNTPGSCAMGGSLDGAPSVLGLLLLLALRRRKSLP